MSESFLTLSPSVNAEYSVSFAERRDIGEEWNLVEWNKRHHEIDCHRLYYRTDKDGGVAKLRLIDREITLESGKIYFIPAFSVVQSEINGCMNKYYVHFRSNSFFLSMYRYLSGAYSVTSNAMTEQLFEMVVQNYNDSAPSSQMRVQGAMNLLLADFYNSAGIDMRGLARFEKVLTFIEQNYKNQISVKDLASLQNVSTTYFANSFKSAFRISPMQYVLHKRLTVGQRLLLETDMSVKEIAYAVGFENQNYFTEFFTQKIGVSPLKYRKRALPKERKSIL